MLITTALIAALLSVSVNPAAGDAGSALQLSGAERDPLVLAQKGADLAGAAYFCKANAEDIEAFISRIEGLIATFSPDTVQTVFAKLEFKNRLTATRARAPQMGCDGVPAALTESLAKLG